MVTRFGKNNGVYLELQESDGTPVIRLSTTDDRVSWTHTDGDNPMELEVTLTGTDSDLSLPVTITQGELYPDDVSTTNLTSEKQ